MRILKDLLNTIPDGEIHEVYIGLHWTAVVADVDGEKRCGLASTLTEPNEHTGEPQVPQAGRLETLSGRNLAALSLQRDHPTLSSVGVAAINALLPTPHPGEYTEGNAEHILATNGAGKRVAIVGRFPFTQRLESRVGELIVLDRNPRTGDASADAAPQVLPNCNVVAITAMALTNHTLEGLLALCSPNTLVMILGPSTPLSPVLFDYGVDMLSGSIVTAIQPVLKTIRQGANFSQVHKAGVQLVTVSRPGTSGR